MKPQTRPPRLIARTLLASFGTVCTVLAVIFVVLVYDTRERVMALVTSNLEASQIALARFERRRDQALFRQAATLAESPTLKAALDTYQSEAAHTGRGRDQLLSTIERELVKLAGHVEADAIAIVDTKLGILGSAGPRASAWPRWDALAPRSEPPGDGEESLLVARPQGLFRVLAVPLALGRDPIGELLVATRVDDAQAGEWAQWLRADTAVVLDHRVVATSLRGSARGAFGVEASRGLPDDGTVDLAGARYAIRRLVAVEGASFYAVQSVDAQAAPATREALGVLAGLAMIGVVIAGLASFWLARTLSRPIKRLSLEMSDMAQACAFERAVSRSGSSRELDSLTDTFNGLMESLAAAQADTRTTYMGVIKTLAAALDARDPYTAGHSERVSALSVRLGRHLALDDRAQEVVRIGALLHDIGKIGVPDEVLRKPGALTPAEFDQIRRHPSLGAQILRPLPFLAEYLPIVELHHERPDGKGYPHGLRGSAVPLEARIVHVADTFDAITSARAYRPARSVAEAVGEIQRGAGTEFDATVVGALVAVLVAERWFDAQAVNAADGAPLLFFPAPVSEGPRNLQECA